MTPSSLSVRHLRSATAERLFRKSGTNGSNPVSSSGESSNFRSLSGSSQQSDKRRGTLERWYDFTNQGQVSGFAGVVHGERDPPQRGLRSRSATGKAAGRRR